MAIGNNRMDSFTFPLGPAYNGSEYSILYATNLVELICHFLLDCPFSALNFLLIFKTSILHPNLKIILLCQSACIFLRGIGRIILIIGRLSIDNMTSSGPTLLFVLYIQPTIVRNFIIHVMVIERIMATFMSKTYEQWTPKWFNVLWITIVTIIATFNAICGSLISSDFFKYFTLFVYIFLIISGLLEIFIFVWIWKYNDQIYGKNMTNPQKSLSERYQLAENIRTSKQMIPCIILHFFNLIDGSMISFARFFQIFEKQFYYDLFCSQQIFICVSIGSFLIELSMIFFHPFLKRDFFRLLDSTSHFLTNKIFRTKQRTSIRRIQPATNPQRCLSISVIGIRGDQLNLDQRAEEICEEHFRQLNTAWQIK